MRTFVLISVCAVPFLWVFLRVFFLALCDRNYFGADPGMELVTFFGQAAILFLFLTLSFNHLRGVSKILGVPRTRRILGLTVFFYATLHLLSYLIFLTGLEFENYFHDLITKKRIIFGSLAYFLLFLLAVTSIDYAVRNLGSVWLHLHRLVYLIAGLVVVHVFLSAKENFSYALFLLFAYLLLLSVRIEKARRKSKFGPRISRA